MQTNFWMHKYFFNTIKIYFHILSKQSINSRNKMETLFFFQCLDEYEDDEAGQKERKREDAITQQNTMQNEAVNLLDPGSSYLVQVSI